MLQLSKFNRNNKQKLSKSNARRKMLLIRIYDLRTEICLITKNANQLVKAGSKLIILSRNYDTNTEAQKILEQ